MEKAKLNPKLVYKYLNSQQQIKDSIKAIRKSNGEITQVPLEIANELNSCFQDVFLVESDEAIPRFETNRENNLTNFKDIDPLEITFETVVAKLKNLLPNKSPGADNLHPILLKNCAESIALPITLIFRASLASSQLPIQFRSANVTPQIF